MFWFMLTSKLHSGTAPLSQGMPGRPSTNNPGHHVTPRVPTEGKTGGFI